MRFAPLTALVLVGAALVVGAGCGGDDADPPPAPSASAPEESRPERPAPSAPSARAEETERPAAPRCPAGADNCEAAGGEIVAMERVDADGDGDLHVVVLGGSITGPGLTVLDVSRDLRPEQDPRIGDWAAGQGPVYRGSYGQRQIEVDEVVFSPPRGG